MESKKDKKPACKTKEMIGGKSEPELDELYKNLQDIRILMDRFAFRLKLAASHYL